MCTHIKIKPEELEKLNTRKNAAIAYRGKVYDVTGYMDKHPAGSDKLLLVAGRDVTGLFDSYHRKSIRGLVSQKCKYIGELEGPVNPKYLDKDPLYDTLEERFYNYFKRNNIDPKIHMPYFCLCAVVMLAMPVLWHLAVLSVYFEYYWLVSCCLAVLHGWTQTLVTLYAHKTTHFMWSHKQWIWKVVTGITTSLVGVSSYVWSYEHVIGHYMHPNHDNLDPDVATKRTDMRRIKPFQKWLPHYRFQHIYMIILYMILSVRMKILDTYVFFSLQKENVRLNPPPIDEVAMFIANKAIYSYYRIVLPSSYISFPSLVFLNLLAEIVTGFLLGVSSQVSHINTDVDYPDPKLSRFNMTWSEMQISTGIDFATDSLLWNIISGGLNCQVCHHLFPGILTIHFKDLAPIMKETCLEFGVKYTCYGTFWEALGSHIQHLKNMSHPSEK